MARNRFIVSAIALLATGIMACGGGGGGGGGDTIVDRVSTLEANDGNGGFLWKPSGDHTGRLVVLLPPEFNGRATAVEIHRQSPPTTESFVESGTYSGIANGNRTHWRYGQNGAGYGQNVFVIVFTNDDQVYSYPIPNGALRVD